MSSSLDSEAEPVKTEPAPSREELFMRASGLRNPLSNKPKQPYEILRMRPREPKPCKECGKENRLPGSSRGAVCKQMWAKKLEMEANLKRRIDKQVATSA